MSERPPWALVYSRRAQQDLRRLDPPVRRRVLIALEAVAFEGDDHRGLKRLSGRPESRLRVGDWRVIVRLDPVARELLVVRVLPRGRAYER